MKELHDIVSLMNGSSAEDVVLVGKAYLFAKEAHTGQKRFSGEPYFSHLTATATDIAAIGMGANTIAAALLHDSVEDVGVKLETIEKEFGKEVAFLVDGVTKLGKLKYHGIERHRESLRKLLIATSKDARVLIIKLMDRLHNMRTLEHVRPEKRKRIALETLEIHAAIAHRLGMSVVRRELEDLAFQHAFPKEFAEAKKLLAVRAKETDERLEHMSRKLHKELAKNGITKFHTDHRVKGLWSLWQKLKRKGGDINNIYDVSALRVVVPTIVECYRVLGIVHHLWQPLPNKIKDYIASTKPNGYKSIHTTVFSGDGDIIEIQIRTDEMHREAQHGIAAHVLYKESSDAVKIANNSGRQSSFDWIRSLIPSFRRDIKNVTLGQPTQSTSKNQRRRRFGSPEVPEWLTELEDEVNHQDFETTLKTDLFSHRVFVFTPKGDVVDLPTSSNSIDFAYAIHSDIGDHIAGVKVNGKMTSLETILQSGDIVEIQTKKSAFPKPKWLDFAKTTLARRHIKNALERVNKK